MIKNLRKKGFTIVELVIVIAVIAILAAILIPTFSSVVNKANEAKIQAELKNAYTQYLAGVSDDKEYDPELRLVFEYTDDKGNSNFYLYDGSVFALVKGTEVGFKIVVEEVQVDTSTHKKTMLTYNTEEKFTENIGPSGQGGSFDTVTPFAWNPTGIVKYEPAIYVLKATAVSPDVQEVSIVGDYIFKYAIFDNVKVYKVELL